MTTSRAAESTNPVLVLFAELHGHRPDEDARAAAAAWRRDLSTLNAVFRWKPEETAEAGEALESLSQPAAAPSDSKLLAAFRNLPPGSTLLERLRAVAAAAVDGR
ncbi:hypothetical protein [Microbacterium sp. 4NA327F11]|uniref:hypothetical protein n=1 Tax=Microbacterium sp. 4NA327F11 TaxID=2502229 RepID=UPI0010F43384|nr:hypothetical protein [Microbacterium sp. 4NA327F11]